MRTTDPQKAKALVEELHALRDGIVKTIVRGEPTYIQRPRPTLAELKEKYGFSTPVILAIRNGTALVWEQLRKEGLEPNYWKLRPNTYGTAKHYFQCAEYEYRFRYQNGYITQKEYRSRRKELTKAMRKLSGMDIKTQGHRTHLQGLYVALKGWSHAKGQRQLQKRIDGVAGGNRKKGKERTGA